MAAFDVRGSVACRDDHGEPHGINLCATKGSGRSALRLACSEFGGGDLDVVSAISAGGGRRVDDCNADLCPAGEEEVMAMGRAVQPLLNYVCRGERSGLPEQVLADAPETVMGDRVVSARR